MTAVAANETPPRARRPVGLPGLGFGWIAIIALAARGLHLWQTRGQPVSAVLLGDAHAYDAWARGIAAGDWLGDEVFYQSPLYPYWLAVVYRLTGGSVTAVRVIQSGLGAASCVMLAEAARRFFSRRVGWVAGLILAVYPTAVFFDGILQKASLDMFLTTLLLLLVARASPRGGPRAWFAIGLVLGALALNRENALVLFVPLTLWAVWLGHDAPAPSSAARAGSLAWTRSWACCALGCALVLAPVAIRNRLVGGELEVTTSQLGPNFFIGNHAGASGRYEPLRWGRGDAEYERSDATELAEKALGRDLSPGEVSRYWLDRGLQYVRSQPLDWLRLIGRKALLLVNWVEITDTEDQYTWAEHSWVLSSTLAFLHMGVVLPLAAAGIVVSLPSLRRIWILHAFLLSYAASVLLFFVTARYRYPLLPLLILFAAVAVAQPWRELGRRDFRTVAIALVAAITAGLVANRRIVDPGTMRATTLINLGTELALRGDKGGAAQDFRRAIQFAPDLGEAQFNLGLALIDLDRLDEAVAPLRRAAELMPDAPAPRQALRWIQNQKTKRAGTSGATRVPESEH